VPVGGDEDMALKVVRRAARQWHGLLKHAVAVACGSSAGGSGSGGLYTLPRKLKN